VGLSFTVAAGPRHRNHSQVRVPRDTLPHFTVTDSRIPQPGGPGHRIYIPQEQGGAVIPQTLGSLSSPLTTRRAMPTSLIAPIVLLITSRRGPQRKHRSCVGLELLPCNMIVFEAVTQYGLHATIHMATAMLLCTFQPLYTHITHYVRIFNNVCHARILYD
jgi:hypothetical protein